MAHLKATDYNTLWDLVRDRYDEVEIGNNTFAGRAHGRGSEGVVEIRLHQTVIVRLFPDGAVEFGCHGWNTVTTRERINQFLPPGHHVHTISRELYLDGQSVDEFDVVTVNP